MKAADMKFDEFSAKFPDVCICEGIGWTLVHVLLSFTLLLEIEWTLSGWFVDLSEETGTTSPASVLLIVFGVILSLYIGENL